MCNGHISRSKDNRLGTELVEVWRLGSKGNAGRRPSAESLDELDQFTTGVCPKTWIATEQVERSRRVGICALQLRKNATYLTLDAIRRLVQRYRRLRGLDDIIARMVKRKHNRRPYGNRRPIVTKQVRLVCWYLLYRIPIGWAITEEDERAACIKFKLVWELWERAKWLKPLIKTVLEKRERRKAFLVANGWIYKGWTPPKPGEKERGSPDWWRSRPEY